jgi:hypothetical protein
MVFFASSSQILRCAFALLQLFKVWFDGVNALLANFGNLADVDDFVGHQLLPLVQCRGGNGRVLGVGAVDRRRSLAQRLLGTAQRIVGFACALGPAVAVRVKRDALNTQADAALLEFGLTPRLHQFHAERPWRGAVDVQRSTNMRCS